MSTTRVLAGVLGAAALASPAAAHGAVQDKLKETYNREYRDVKRVGGDPGLGRLELSETDFRFSTD